MSKVPGPTSAADAPVEERPAPSTLPDWCRACPHAGSAAGLAGFACAAQGCLEGAPEIWLG